MPRELLLGMSERTAGAFRATTLTVFRPGCERKRRTCRCDFWTARVLERVGERRVRRDDPEAAQDPAFRLQLAAAAQLP